MAHYHISLDYCSSLLMISLLWYLPFKNFSFLYKPASRRLLNYKSDFVILLLNTNDEEDLLPIMKKIWTHRYGVSSRIYLSEKSYTQNSIYSNATFVKKGGYKYIGIHVNI